MMIKGNPLVYFNSMRSTKRASRVVGSAGATLITDGKGGCHEIVVRERLSDISLKYQKQIPRPLKKCPKQALGIFNHQTHCNKGLAVVLCAGSAEATEVLKAMSL
jgi:hypothetical protein